MTDLTSIGVQAATMTSLELVEFINQHRRQQAEEAGQSFPSDDFPELLHKNFLAKVPEVLGERSADFSADLPDSYGRPRRGYRFPKREACLMAMSYSYDLQAAVFDHMTALEERLKALPDVSSHEGALLALQGAVERQLVLIGENKQLAAERDHAVKTKAQIGSRREAQAMAAASVAIRQVKRLNDELGHGTRYATVTAVENATGTKYPFNAYVHLRKWCKANGVQPEIVPDRRFGEVKAWPAGAWAAVYQIDLATLFGASGAKA
ncbi:ORF6N domain-containing protein [Pseudomonas aeruginosa]|uniref:ORF6N domain-containing protein n=1 Tax=Pseudomonas aeruginosa TaxID=287 RepID=UPI001FD0E383|nr:ORF6N domain-containing protein [Pseudomonas aeruginosa]MCM5669618.1 ORF6N domain-containing protein [Pseudomonas aeruginosa]